MNPLFKRSSVSGKVPALSDVLLGQIAINTADGTLYTRTGTGVASDSIVPVNMNVGFDRFMGQWDANANTPSLASGVGISGQYYTVSTAGSTTLNGISSWAVGDTVFYQSGSWNKISAAVNIPIASVSTLGGVKQGLGVSIAADGTLSVTNSSTQPYDICAFVSGTLTASQVMLYTSVGRAFTIPAGATNSQCKALTAATATSVLQINRNGSSVGTITFVAPGTTGIFSFTNAVSFSVGDVLTVTAPSTPDTTLASVGITLIGTAN